MVRASLYLLAAGAIWLAEAFIFSRFFGFTACQTALAGVLYIALFGAATAYLLRSLYRDVERGVDLARWRILAMAPMIATVVGSFAALPVLIGILLLGKTCGT